jgi:hypothetical protein
MKYWILVLAWLMAAPAHSQVVPAQFGYNTDLRPYVTWIALNTRFVDALTVTSDEVPEIRFLTGIEYMQLVRVWGAGAYSPDGNTIVINQDLDGNQDFVLIHELIHFYQWRTDQWTRGDYESREQEAQAITRKFLLQKKQATK